MSVSVSQTPKFSDLKEITDYKKYDKNTDFYIKKAEENETTQTGKLITYNEIEQFTKNGGKIYVLNSLENKDVSVDIGNTQDQNDSEGKKESTAPNKTGKNIQGNIPVKGKKPIPTEEEIISTQSGTEDQTQSETKDQKSQEKIHSFTQSKKLDLQKPPCLQDTRLQDERIAPKTIAIQVTAIAIAALSILAIVGAISGTLGYLGMNGNLGQWAKNVSQLSVEFIQNNMFQNIISQEAAKTLLIASGVAIPMTIAGTAELIAIGIVLISKNVIKKAMG